MQKESEEFVSAKQFLKAIKEFVQSSTLEGEVGEALQSLIKDLPKPITLQNLIEQHNVSGENIFHLIARSREMGVGLYKLYSTLPQDAIDTLLSHKSDNDEMPFHLACRYLNSVVFEFIVEKMQPDLLWEIATIANSDAGYNAFHLLLVGGYSAASLPLREFCEEQDFSELKVLNAEQFESLLISDGVFSLIVRFTKIFGEKLDNLLLATDWQGNNALTLACFTRNDLLIQSCISSFKNCANLMEAVSVELPGSGVTALKLLCALASPETLRTLFAKLEEQEDLLSQLCLQQQALVWCYLTTRGAEDQDDFKLVLELVAKAYGDNLEYGAIGSERWPSFLIRSLREDGVIPTRILEKKLKPHLVRRHFHAQNEIVCELLLDFQFVGNLQPNIKLYKHHEILRKSLLDNILKANWPRATLLCMSDALAEKMQDIPKTADHFKTAILEIIIENNKASSCVPFACFYKIGSIINELENTYLELFQSDKQMLERVGQFYEIAGEVVLERILTSRSILKLALLNKLSLSDYDEKIRAPNADIQAIRNEYILAIGGRFLPVLSNSGRGNSANIL